MKKFLTVILSVFTATCASAGDYRQLDSLLSCFYEAMGIISVEEKCREFDSLITMCGDSLTRQHVALQIFEHYKEPPLMGDEDVSIHIYDTWFAPGKVEFPGKMYGLEAGMFVEFNRSTLIGCKAPVLEMKDNRGKKRTFPAEGKVSILYFYDTACAKCKLESRVLPGILDKIPFEACFYAVYCGQDLKEWRRFRKEFRTSCKNLRVIHLEDKDFDTEYLRLYGVISTPRLYMTDPNGIVIGRRLEPESLQQLIPTAYTIQQEYEKTRNQRH